MPLCLVVGLPVLRSPARVWGMLLACSRSDSQSLAADLSMQSARLGAAQKAIQLQEFPAAELSLASEKEPYGNIFDLKHAPPSNGMGVTIASPVSDANLAAAALESTLAIKSPTPAAT